MNTNENKLKKSSLPNIIFGFDKSWELKNWYDTCTKNVTYDPRGEKKWDLGGIPQEVETAVEEGRSVEEIQARIKDIFTKFIDTPKAVRIMQDITERSKKRWDEVNSECFSALSKMLDIPIEEFEQNYFVFFTFSKRVPFYENKFMFNQFSDFPNTASHEIMHIEFLKRYNKYCLDKGLTEMQISHLKEILTVLLNEDLNEFLYLTDRGYDSHKKIRHEVLKLYKDHKKTKENFSVFLDEAIGLLKDQWGHMMAK